MKLMNISRIFTIPVYEYIKKISLISDLLLDDSKFE
jgi:hypothetical protein